MSIPEQQEQPIEERIGSAIVKAAQTGLGARSRERRSLPTRRARI